MYDRQWNGGFIQDMINNCWLPTIKDSLFIIYVNQQLYTIFIPSRRPSDTFKTPSWYLSDISQTPPINPQTPLRHSPNTRTHPPKDLFRLSTNWPFSDTPIAFNKKEDIFSDHKTTKKVTLAFSLFIKMINLILSCENTKFLPPNVTGMFLAMLYPTCL